MTVKPALNKASWVYLLTPPFIQFSLAGQFLAVALYLPAVLISSFLLLTIKQMSKFPPKCSRFQLMVSFGSSIHRNQHFSRQTKKKKKSININKVNLKREKEIRKETWSKRWEWWWEEKRRISVLEGLWMCEGSVKGLILPKINF